MLCSDFEFVRLLHRTHYETNRRRRFSVTYQILVFLTVASLLSLVLLVGSNSHASDDTAGEFIPERLQYMNPLMLPILITLCTLVTASDYTMYSLLCILLDGRLHPMLLTFCALAVGLCCNITVEYFIIQSVGSSNILYLSKNLGTCMAIYLRAAVVDLGKWNDTRQ